MGFSIYYRSTRALTPAEAEAVRRKADSLIRGRSWLACEPVAFFPDQGDGHLIGGSKPNSMPHPDDAASAGEMPDGTTRDILEVLSILSRDHRVEWEISHDHSEGPIGFIRDGVVDEEVSTQMESFADLADILGDLEEDEPVRGSGPQGASPGFERPEDGDEGPSILPFRPKG